MASLILKSGDGPAQVLELKLGLNRLGRAPDNDFQIDHPTVSTHHCDIILADGQVTVHDRNSTNGTFVAGKPIREEKLYAGQTLCVGDVELFLETTDVNIAIPRFEAPKRVGPAFSDDGALLCPRHPRAHVTYQCTHCHEVLCDGCVHRLGRRGGKPLFLCPVCSSRCEPLAGPPKPKKKSILGFLQKTVKLDLFHRHPRQ
jgi:hypothetical protein